MGLLSALLLASLVSIGVRAQSAPLHDVIAQLRQGGYVLVMRHASSPREAPSKERANPDNLRLERQLDASGRRGATEMGMALRDLKVPIAAVLTSPTYRALETVRLAGFTSPTVVEELGDNGQSMQGVTESQAEWLRRKVTETSARGNVLVVTHQPNLAKAFPSWGPGVADGETVVLRPNATGDVTVVARIPIEAWRAAR
jgi:phosphohistidine phosphatase SixA